MSDIVLLGATGFTGRLTARALTQQGASFAIAGRGRAKLEALSAELGGPPIRVVQPGDAGALARALEDAAVLITCVGPFLDLGEFAAQAALQARVHYVDCTGEGVFVEKLIARYEGAARSAGIAVAPAIGLLDALADVAATLATQDLERPELVLTYALPRDASRGTLRSALGVIAAPAPWIEDGETRMVRAGQEQRWAPLPPPLGPRLGASFLFPENHLAPLHLDLRSLKLFATLAPARRYALKAALPLFQLARSTPPLRRGVDKVISKRREGPAQSARQRDGWTILAEARSEQGWRNVALQGQDAYGLTARLLAATASKMLEPGYERAGVVAPTDVLGLDDAQKVLADRGVSITTFGPSTEGA